MSKKVAITAFTFLALLMPSSSMAQHQASQPRPQKPDEANTVRHHGANKPFNPEEYNRKLECFITQEAKLTASEAQVFFPVFREMLEKQRAIYNKNRQLFKKGLANEQLALEIIRMRDEQEIQIKTLQQQYHTRFLKILPASKVLKCIYAEERFNRDMMRNMFRK